VTKEEHAAIIDDAERRERERLRTIVQHGQGKGLDPLARYLAFSTDISRIEALQILAAARGCLDDMVDAEIASRVVADANHRQQLVESAENIVPLRRANHE
jgi:hypothetical protein